MCGLCGSFTDIHWSTGPALPARPAAGRVALAREAARAASGSGVAIAAWGQGFRVTGPTGRTTLAADLGALWLAVDALGRKAPDPLSEDFLAALERR
ncbi:MAG: hypothetical protein J0H11_16275 [Rhizobiales bacterium]|nr:hypothetical protein [Hyphomicrobiales bacterium]